MRYELGRRDQNDRTDCLNTRELLERSDILGVVKGDGCTSKESGYVKLFIYTEPDTALSHLIVDARMVLQLYDVRMNVILI